MTFISAYKQLYTAIVSLLADIPNIEATHQAFEIQSVIENGYLSKDGAFRLANATIEAIDTASLESCADMMEAAITAMGGLVLPVPDFAIIGVVLTQSQTLTEAADTQNIVYRGIMTFDIYIQKK